MADLYIDPSIDTLLNNFTMPDQLGFGVVKSPVMYRADFANGEWQQGQLLPYGPIEIDPAAKVLHYAQEVFEGQKAYCVSSERAQFFRPLENMKRLNRSCERMEMQTVSERVFMEGISTVTAYSEKLIPRCSGESLYLRPFLFGTQSNLGMGVSDTFVFMVIASPSAIYHSGNMRVLIERDACRAARGGTGAAKTGGNYAAALQSARRTQAKGFDQSLWLDPANMRDIEELSGMNFFALIGNELHTPRITGSFLSGITRDSIITLAKSQGVTVVERDMPINELLPQIRNGECVEAFACGTAAIVSPISVIADADGQEYQLAQVDQTAAELRSALLALQEGRAEDPFGWTQPIADEFYPS